MKLERNIGNGIEVLVFNKPIITVKAPIKQLIGLSISIASFNFKSKTPSDTYFTQ